MIRNPIGKYIDVSSALESVNSKKTRMSSRRRNSDVLSFGTCECCEKDDTVIAEGICASCSASVECTNFHFCGGREPAWIVEHFHEGYCSVCNALLFETSFYKNPLRFRTPGQPDSPSCCVCMEKNQIMMKFPAVDCVHWFCVQCSRDIILDDKTRYCVDPRLFGCPPCPNGCNNPVEGKQCGCAEYKFVQQKWRSEDPWCFEIWNEYEFNNVHTEHFGTFFGCKSCPLCRRKI